MSEGRNMSLLTGLEKMRCKASSTLNKSAEFSSKHLFDGIDDTCWNSDQGETQYIFLDFGELVTPRSLVIQFQGGFCGELCTITCGLSSNSLSESGELHMVDHNAMQEFPLEIAAPCRYMKLGFSIPTDFYGRITVYHLRIYGDVDTAIS